MNDKYSQTPKYLIEKTSKPSKEPKQPKTPKAKPRVVLVRIFQY